MKDLSLHLLDIVQNSIRAKAPLIRITIEESLEKNQLMICIEDNGKGMNSEELEQATDPFYTSRTTRKVGLGLSLFKQNAEMTGGSLQIESEPNVGTKVTALFTLNHPDRPILGDLAGTLLLIICSDDGSDYLFKYLSPEGFYEFDTREIKQTLDDVPVNHPEIRAFLGKMIRQNLEQIQISKS